LQLALLQFTMHMYQMQR